MPLIGIVAQKREVKDIKRKLGDKYELIELTNESKIGRASCRERV